MGITSSIEKVAFQPPDPKYTRHVLSTDRFARNLCYTPTAIPSTRISLLVFDGRAPAAATSSSSRRDITILFSHGNAEDLGHSVDFFQGMARSLRCRFVAYDYIGYGLSSEGQCSEETAMASANAAFKYVVDELQAPRNTIVLCGRSLGSGPTTDLASRERGLGGLILLSPLASAAAVAGRAAAVVASFFDIFKNIDKIDAVTDYPVMIFHGTADEVIDVEHGKRLYRAAKAKNDRVFSRWVEGAMHNDVEVVMGREYVTALDTFLNHVVDPSVTVRSDGPGVEPLSSFSSSSTSS